MKAAIMRGFAKDSKFSVEEIERPKCGNSDVLIEVYSSSVNPLDWKLHDAFAYLPINLVTPLILGRDISGVVIEKGAKVNDLNVGDEVYGLSLNFLKGTYAEFAVVNAKHVARKPKNLSMAEAAAVPLVGLTALQALKHAKLQAGSRVVVVGASGGVGTMAVQIAKAFGATVIGVCSGRNKALVESLGADQVIDYTQQNYLDAVTDIDLIFDTTGNESLSKCNSVMKKTGRFLTTMPNLATALNLVESTVGLKSQKVQIASVKTTRKSLETLTQLIEAKQLKPVIDSEYPFEKINESHQKSKTKHAQGKIVVTMREKETLKKTSAKRLGVTEGAV